MSTSTDLNNSPSILLPGLRNLAEKLQEAAQALIEFSQANPATNHNSENRSGSPEPATKNAVQSFEVRSYEIHITFCEMSRNYSKSPTRTSCLTF